MKEKTADAPCRIALFGCGAVSELHYSPVLRHLETEGLAELRVVVDADADRATKFCAPFPKATFYRDESFLKKIPLDLVIIASPVSFHEAHAVAALEAGVAVLCEKPIAGDTSAGERMIAAAQKHRQTLAVGLLRRFYTNVQFTRQLIQNKTLGAVKSFSIQEGGVFNWPAKSDSLFRKKTGGGGVLLDIGVHVLDLVVHWFGEPEAMTYADDAMGGIEANCKIELSYSTGCKGTMQLSRDWQTANLYVIEFERGTLKIRAGDAENVELDLGGSTFTLKGPLTEESSSSASGHWANSFQEAFMVQVKDLLFAVKTGSRPTVPAEEGIRSLRLIERCYQTRTLMEMTWLGAEEQKAGRLLAAGGSR